MKNYNNSRLRPKLNITVNQETKDLIDTFVQAYGVNRSRVVDALITLVCMHPAEEIKKAIIGE